MEIINVKLSVTNCFLIKSRTKYILFDTGYEYEWELFCKRLKEVNININEISHIVLTHHHDDHCGLLNKILEENSEIKVVMSYLSKNLLLKGENDNSNGGLINKRIKLIWLLNGKRLKIMLSLKKYIDPKRNLKFPPYRARKNDIIITGETSLRDLGIELDGRIIETPGHTVDSISIVFDDGDCIVGDAAANMLQFAGTKYCVIYVRDIDEYYRSWEKIISMNAKKIFPAHGKEFYVEKLKENIRKNKKANMVMNK